MITPDCYMIDRRIISEAKTLQRAGNHVTLLAGFECKEEEEYIEEGIIIRRFVYDWDDSRVRRIREKLPAGKVRDIVCKCLKKFICWFTNVDSFERYMIDRLLRVNADIIHVHDLPCLKVGCYAARKKKVPLIFDAHEIYYAQETLNEATRAQLFKTERKYIKKCNAVITVNPYIAELMEKRDRISRPYVLMNCEEFFDSIAEAKKQHILHNTYHIPEEAKIVIYQGWISSERNIDTIVEAAKYVSDDIYIVIVGYGSYEQILKDLCQKNNTVERVIFTGAVPNDIIINYTVDADLGVIPYQPIDDNHLYCSPNKLFEFVMAELPFICNDLPFLNYVKEKYGVLETVNMSEAKEVAATIERILSDEVEIERLKKRCSEARKELNWTEEGKKLIKIYDNISKYKGGLKC